MEERAFERHDLAHGPAGGWEMFDAFGAFVGVSLLLVLLALAAWGAYRLVGDLRVGAWMDPAESIRRERFARGEIPARDYEEALEILRRHPPQGESGPPSITGGPGRRYEQYVREAMSRLRLGRNPGS